MVKLDISRVPEFYHKYIFQVADDNLVEAFRNNTNYAPNFLSSISPEKYDYRYEDGKWTIKEVLQHIIDSERVFSYRALRFARKDQTALPGFDENLFAANANANNRKWNDVIEEFLSVRKSTELLFNSFGEEQLNATGVANNAENYVLAIGFICVGHCAHHMTVIKERYL